jgi:phosphoserine phosphatase
MTKIVLLHQDHLTQAVVEKICNQFSPSSVTRRSTRAIEIELFDGHHAPLKKSIQDAFAQEQIDTIFLKEGFDIQHIRLLAFDMDSTLINIECIDEIARAVGKTEEVSQITQASMRGEIKDFSEGLRARVQLLKGTPESFLHEVFEKRLKLNPGAQALITGAKKRGLHTLLVSGGFTFFTSRIQKQLELDEAYSNILEIKDGLLTGELLGPIVDGQAKADFVSRSCKKLGVNTSASITLGDGSNDLPMMAISGLSIGYQPKPIVQEKADGTFWFVGLDSVLELYPAT